MKKNLIELLFIIFGTGENLSLWNIDYKQKQLIPFEKHDRKQIFLFLYL